MVESMGIPHWHENEETFYTELTLLLQAKITLKQALLFMQDAQRNNQRKAFYTQLLYSLNQGEHLYQALENKKGLVLMNGILLKLEKRRVP